MSDKGYVYILTNPSFKDDWVKIGQTSKTVEERIASLDGTAVPLPFKKFASMKTASYERAERLIHKMIDLLAGEKRIRKNREFFNISPWTALEIFEDVAEVLDDAEVEQFSEGIEKDDHASEPKRRSISETGAMLLEFWAGLKDHVHKNAPHLVRFLSQKHLPQNYYDIHVGLNNCHIIIGVSMMHKWIRIGIWSNGDKELQDLLVSKKRVFETALGGDFESSGNKCTSLNTYQDFDISDRDSWESAYAWYVKKLPLLRDAMHQVVKGS